MTSAPLASIDQLEAWLGHPLVGHDATRADAMLKAASSLVRTAAGTTWDGVPVPEDVQTVTLTVAARVYRNPDAAAQYSRSTGPFTKSVTFANPAAVGLYLSAEEKAIVGRYRGAARGLWTLPTSRGEYPDVGWVPVAGATLPFPWYAEDLL